MSCCQRYLVPRISRVLCVDTCERVVIRRAKGKHSGSSHDPQGTPKVTTGGFPEAAVSSASTPYWDKSPVASSC